MNNPKLTVAFGTKNPTIIHDKCWQKITISKSMETIAGGVTLESIPFFMEKIKLGGRLKFSEKIKKKSFIDYKKIGWNISLSDAYSIKINNKLVSTGYIDQISTEYGDENKIKFEGRDKTADLADCHFAPHLRKDWFIWNFNFSGNTGSDLIQIICDNFDIILKKDASIEKEDRNKFEKLSIDIGQSIIEIIMKICMTRGYLPVNYGDGKLTLTTGKIDKRIKGLITENNVKSARLLQTNVNRYSVYQTIGQTLNLGEKTETGDYVGIDGIHYDKTTSLRFRPYVILSDMPVNIKDCERRSKFEANIRAGQSRYVEYILEGWTQPDSDDLWNINMLVPVDDNKLGISEDLLISEVDFTLDPDTGYETRLKLVHKNTYSLTEQTKLINIGFKGLNG